MSQEFNWNDVAYEMAPISQYSDFYSNQPKIYMFEGGTLIDLIILLITAILTLYWLLSLFRSQSGLTKSLITITISQIFVNIGARLIKSLILICVEYPQYSWLFVTSSVETTFHYTLYLQYTSSVLLYVLLREKEIKSSWTMVYYIPSISIGVLVSILNVNFNKLLFNIPFYLYAAFYVGMEVANVVMLIGILVSCTKHTRDKLSIRCRLFLFILISSPPILFNTLITIMDLLFMVVGITDQFPIPYIVMTTYRFKAFEVTPIFIMIAFFALMPDLKKWGSSKTTTSAEVTTIAPKPDSSSTQSRTISVPTSQSVETYVPIPNRIDLPPLALSNVAPAPTYGNLNYDVALGSLIVHIQPVANT